jgi:formylglycine-generating enzyme required for sulfatase activity
MVDQRLEDLKRRHEADPDNVLLQLKLINARARVEGSSVYLEPLDDRLKWNECSESIQNLAITAVGQNLDPDYEWLETQVYSCAGISHRIASFTHLKSGLILNLVPGGTFIMGDDKSGFEEEGPAHEVRVKPLLIGRFPVRQSCWDKFGGDDERAFEGPHLPMDSVSWDDCQAWLNKAGGNVETGILRLPSETEWEYACRAGSTTEYSWGDEMDDSFCWYDKNCYEVVKKTQNVTSHFESGKCNSFGLVDMSGNISEWCQDWFVDSYRRTPRDSQPFSEKGGYRVIRGGSWVYDAQDCRSANRYNITPTNGGFDLGLRVARSI